MGFDFTRCNKYESNEVSLAILNFLFYSVRLTLLFLPNMVFSGEIKQSSKPKYIAL